MKKILLFIFTFFALAACNKETNTSLIKGKLVFDQCNNDKVIQVLDNGYENYVQSWEYNLLSMRPMKSHQNVFKVKNTDAIPSSIHNGDEIYFSFSDNGTDISGYCDQTSEERFVKTYFIQVANQ